MDSAITKHLLGEKSAGPNPTDSSKSGNKRSLLVESQDILFGIKKKKRRMPKYRTRRWVVESIHSWINRFR